MPNRCVKDGNFAIIKVNPNEGMFRYGFLLADRIDPVEINHYLYAIDLEAKKVCKLFRNHFIDAACMSYGNEIKEEIVRPID